MSSGAVLNLITSDGKADRMIMASQLLTERIKVLSCLRKQSGKDPTPTLSDIERTHILHVNAHYKPYAAVAFEYNKVPVNSGAVSWGQQLQFSIPQFGDFISDMVVHVKLAPVAASPGTVPQFPAHIGPDDQSTTATASVSGKEDTDNGVYTQYTYQWVDADDNVLAVGSQVRNFVRYCDYPGLRLFEHVKFEVNGNPLDEYYYEDAKMHSKTCIQPNKLVGWKRLLGQEVPVKAYSDLASIAGSARAPSFAADLVDVNDSSAPGSLKSAALNTRHAVEISDGPQTPKAEQPQLDLWVPLLFWFNRNANLAVPSVAIPYGQRFITIHMARQEDLVSVAPGNLFLKLTVQQQLSADGATAGTSSAVAVEQVDTVVTRTPYLAAGSAVDSTQRIISADLYINNIFVLPEVHDIYIKRIGFTLIRVHRSQTTTLNTNQGQQLLNNLKWPVECIKLSAQPQYNTSAANPNRARDWYENAKVEDLTTYDMSSAVGEVMIDDAVAFDAANAAHKFISSREASKRYVAVKRTETLDKLAVQAQGVTLYQSFNSEFYRDYLSFSFGNHTLVTPEDEGVYIINFSLFPGDYQPSGHINISRVREFYLDYTSGVISNSEPAKLIVSATAINFLLVTDGSAVLRYST